MLIKLLLAGFLSFHISFCLGQLAAGHFAVNHYTDENGLPQNSIKSIAADQQGFVWFITEGGMVRFDGRHFYTFSKLNMPIQDNRFYAILPYMQKTDPRKKNGRFYAATDKGDYVSTADGRAVIDSLYAKKLKNLPVFKGDGFNTFMASGLPFIQTVPNLSHYILPVADQEGSFYVCDSNGAGRYSQWKKTAFYTYKTRLLSHYFLHQQKLYHYLESGHIASLGSSGVQVYPISGAILSDPTFKSAKKDIQIYWNIINDQVFLYLNKNLYLLHTRAGGMMDTELIVRNFNFNSLNVQTVYYDAVNQAVYLGSVTQGLFVLRAQPFQVLTTPTDDLIENVFYAQTAYGRDAVLTPRGMILKKQEDGSTGPSRVSGNMGENGIDNRGILTDKNGMRWLKNYQYLNRYNARGDKMLNQWNLHDEIKTIYADSTENIWMGLKNKGLFRINAEADHAVPEQFALTNLSNVSYITSLSRQTLLVGTEHGLYTVDLKTKKPKLIEGTQHMFIKSIYAPEPGQIWITAQDQGIMLFYRNKLTIFPFDRNKYLTSAHCLFEDQKGFFWITTNKGLFRARKHDMLRYAAASTTGKNAGMLPDELPYEYYNKNAGFLTNEFNGGCQPCALRLGNQYVSLPSINGLVWFVPEQIQSADNSGKIYFDQVIYNQKSFAAATGPVLLPVDARSIQFQFTTPYFGHPDNLNLYYALVRKGADLTKPDWSPVGSDELNIHFSSLSSGEYILLVKRVSGFGANNYDIRQVSVKVAQWWYETWLFRLALLVIFTMAVYGLIRLRTRYLERKNMALEIRISDRTRKLETALAELEQSRSELSRQLTIRTRLVASMSHDIMTPMSFMASAADRIGSMIGQQKYDLVTRIGADIAVSARHIRQLLENTIQYIKTQYRQERVPFDEVMVQELINQKITLFSLAIENQKNVVSNKTDASVSVFSSPHLLAIIIHNILDNANKFTSGGSIKIYTEQNQGRLHLIVADSGKGMPEPLLEWLNRNDAEDTEDLDREIPAGVRGLGLIMVKEIAAILRIDIHVEIQQGTIFRLIFEME